MGFGILIVNVVLVAGRAGFGTASFGRGGNSCGYYIRAGAYIILVNVADVRG